MAKVLVIGYGNPLRRDDGLGWYTAQQLAETISNDDIQVVVTQQLNLDMAEQVSQSDFVIFIDACWGEPAGQIASTLLYPKASTSTSISHFLEPSTLLGCAHVLYGTQPEGLLICVTTLDFGYGESLSAAVDAAFHSLVERIPKLAEHLSQRTEHETFIKIVKMQGFEIIDVSTEQ